ncbi:sialoadhesin-like [Epinephelus fuscoguttatus]|uniref:sialoadhesin-like n=1 Tax=Epinephelus fuscoguttatus TaxID=293821 RepID=UPI0020D13B5B|nr:sialoadhesin-like [Epinephelus fuscoguttatus]
MLSAEAGCVFVGFILYISGAQGRENSICALKGTSVYLNCSAKRGTSSNKWYTVRWNGSTYTQNELSADGYSVSYNMSEKRPTLKINDVRESDANKYCCRETADNPQLCWRNSTGLRVTDLQVKVIPTTEGQTVTLICSTSCPLTENPAAYIWYKNREFLYQDWSPWYHQLVSSEEAVTYSCAIKGYEHLRAPKVSVDSVTSTCFTVTYAGGRMCSDRQTPCSITYPREVKVQRNSTSATCTTSCPVTNSKPADRLNQKTKSHSESQQQRESSSAQSFYCAVKDLEDLLSEFCTEDNNCTSVNYVTRRICALPGSSVNITSLRVRVHPAEVTEGQNVTLSCITSCPLPRNTTYIWYLNSRPLTKPRKHNKTLILRSVSSRHAGNYSCAVEGGITSGEKTLTVQNVKGRRAAAAATGVCIVLLVTILLIVFLWIREKRTSGQSPETETMDNTEQRNLGHVYENISARPTEQEEFHYSRVHFSVTQPDTLYSTIQPHQPEQQEHVAYATVNCRPNMTPE